MPPMMVTRESCVGSFDYEEVRYYIFVAPYNSKDCYYFLQESFLDSLPTTRLGIQKLADLGIYCDNWDLSVKNRDDGIFHKAVLDAARNVLAVEEVHAL